MLKTGLTSVTFRSHSPEDVVNLAVKAGLDGIEWGGDVHVPPGDPALAQHIRSLTENAGLAVCSYGAYCRCDLADDTFDDSLATTQALGAPIIRLWAGRKPLTEVTPAYRAEVVQRLLDYATRAADKGILVGLEYHAGTLTETQDSALSLVMDVNHPTVKLYWQPRAIGTFPGNLAEARAVAPHLAHIHAFHWNDNGDGTVDRRPLHEGKEDWRYYLQALSPAPDLRTPRYLILEFVRDNDPDQFLKDALTLQEDILTKTPPAISETAPPPVAKG